MFVFLVRKDEKKMQTDIFGIQKLFNTTTREWYSQFHIGPERTRVFGAAGVYDPGLVFRGTGTYTIYGQTGDSNNGILNVSGSCPRIYVRDSVLNHSVVPIGTPMWKNVEVTFYSNTIKTHQASFLHNFFFHLIIIYVCPVPCFLEGQA